MIRPGDHPARPRATARPRLNHGRPRTTAIGTDSTARHRARSDRPPASANAPQIRAVGRHSSHNHGAARRAPAASSASASSAQTTCISPAPGRRVADPPPVPRRGDGDRDGTDQAGDEPAHPGPVPGHRRGSHERGEADGEQHARARLAARAGPLWTEERVSGPPAGRRSSLSGRSATGTDGGGDGQWGHSGGGHPGSIRGRCRHVVV